MSIGATVVPGYSKGAYSGGSIVSETGVRRHRGLASSLHPFMCYVRSEVKHCSLNVCYPSIVSFGICLYTFYAAAIYSILQDRCQKPISQQ